MNVRAFVILLQVGFVEPGTHDVTFKACYEGLNEDQYFYMIRPDRVRKGHQHWLKGPMNPLTNVESVEYVAKTIGRILRFLQMK